MLLTDDARRQTAEVHRRLLQAQDLQVWHWHPATSALDVCLGAILVQHTAWTNVEKALANLRQLRPLSWEVLSAISKADLAQLVKPAGMPLTKARRLKSFASLVTTAGGIEALLSEPAPSLRALLLATPGIGPETADVILLYAARVPVVVHDSYTARLFRRLGIGPEQNSYNAWRVWLDQALDPNLAFRQAIHAAIVLHCKELCRVRPKCRPCPLLSLCPFGQAQEVGY